MWSISVLFWLMSLVVGDERVHFEGVVVHGAHMARLIDWPTANVRLDEQKLECGFYSTETNYGHATTFVAHHGAQLEVHIHNFDGTLYGKRLRLWNVQRLETTGPSFFNWFNRGCQTAFREPALTSL